MVRKFLQAVFCQAISVKMQQTTFFVDFIFITFSGFNMILGINLLQTLDPII